MNESILSSGNSLHISLIAAINLVGGIAHKIISVSSLLPMIRCFIRHSFMSIHDREKAKGTDEKPQHPHTHDIFQCLKYVY